MEEIRKRLEQIAKEGKIPCRKALEFAEKEGIPPKKVGELLNELGIKIVSCQLGCFP
jgi:hypothetical protein